MGKSKDHVGKYMFVWGDTVVLKELAISAVICVILTMVFYLAGMTGLLQIQSLDPALAKGYSLLVGIVVTFLGAAICAKTFKPKRKIMVEFQSENIEDILKAAGMTMEEESEALRHVSKEVIREMENLELYSLLSLIPEDCDNFKPEYRQKIHGKEGN